MFSLCLLPEKKEKVRGTEVEPQTTATSVWQVRCCQRLSGMLPHFSLATMGRSRRQACHSLLTWEWKGTSSPPALSLEHDTRGLEPKF